MRSNQSARDLLEMAKGILGAKDEPFERDDDGYAKVSFRIRGDALHSLLRLLKQCDHMGSIGHSFTIVLDPDNSEYRRKVGFDGDGSDDVKDICVNGEPIPDKFEW